MRKRPLYYLSIFVLSLLISLPVILPYFKNGYFPTHDGEWAVVRLADMYREVKGMEIPVRYSNYLNFQYGYPLFNYTYPMPYYLGLIFVFLKFGFVGSVKFLFAASVVFSFLTMFFLSKSVWKNTWAGIISGIFYIYVPYRIVDLYVRGSVGESLSFVLFPLILLFVKRIYESKRLLLDILGFGFFYALLITMHNIMAVLFGILILFIILISLFKKNIVFVKNILFGLVYSLCLSAFFWVPAIFEKNLIKLSQIPIADRNLYFVNPLDLVIPKWGYGVPTDVNGFGYQIGVPQLIIFFASLLLALLRYKNKDSKITILLITGTVLMSLLLFSFSSIIWQNTPLLSEINYPWTVLAILVFLIALLAGFLTKFGAKFISVALILSVLAMLFITPHAKPQTTVNRGDDFYSTNQATTTSSNELMPLWVKKEPFQQASEKVTNLTGQETINLREVSSKKIAFDVFLPQKRTIQVNLIYFPGWTVYVNGAVQKINYDNLGGLIRFDLEKGANKVQVLFKENSLALFSDLISLTSILVLLGLFVADKIKFRKNS